MARLLVERGARVDRLWHAAALGMRSRAEELIAASPPGRQQLTDAFWQACHGGQRRMAAYSVTVNNPLPGSTTMVDTAVSTATGSNCAADSSDPLCTATVGIVSGALSVTIPGNAEIIPVGNATYSVSGLTGTTGPATFAVTGSLDLTANPQAVISATNVTGNTNVTWTPQLQIAIPGGAIGGDYSATIINSVS